MLGIVKVNRGLLVTAAFTLIESLPIERAVAKANYRKIADVCRVLLSSRKTPYIPTAALVAETGATMGGGDPAFPSERTIYNTYPEMLRIWKRAFDDLTNIMADDPLTFDDLESIDLGGVDANTRAVFDELFRIIREQRQRIAGLKKLITDNVKVDADAIPSTSGRAIESLDYWIGILKLGLFTVDDDGVKVSRKTPIGTLILDASTLAELETLIEDFKSAEKRRRAGEK
ncbi:hypothetical protein ASC90_07765 [Rhizobium sp. Root1220]|nr:hypothetical protein ASC90_07765 [Rhizobium sp. Root1220]